MEAGEETGIVMSEKKRKMFSCQSARKIDPGSASNFDPPARRAVGAF